MLSTQKTITVKEKQSKYMMGCGNKFQLVLYAYGEENMTASMQLLQC